MKIVKRVYTKEYWILLGIGFLPLLWKILEIAFLAGFDHALKIVGQLSFISIIFKIFEETLLNPLYKMLGKHSTGDEQEKIGMAKKFLLWYGVATLIFTVLIFLFNPLIVRASQVPQYIFSETVVFLKIYTIACGLGIVSKYLYTFSVIHKDTKKMLVYFLIKSLITTLLFVVFIPTFTLGWGVNGIAIAELIVNMLTIIYLWCTFEKTEKVQVVMDQKQYFQLLGFAFLETMIRNIVYYCVILVFLNMLDNQDLYFVANEYIWSIMLVPTLAQGTLIKQDIASNQHYSLKPYFVHCGVLILFMCLCLPISMFVFRDVYHLVNYMEYFDVLLKLFPCYMLFVLDSVVEAYFFATGKLHHILVQNVLTNVCVYLTAFVLYLCKVWVVSLDSILILFNVGVVVSSLYTLSVYYITKQRQSTKQV